ncbi:hypothetical protein MSG28_015445 [Choristoneura fumiferana]|uniref:Uncharacterized protein n=1 Tax=Choristoneura fumiferana TaxID=7141 RepID=A0ACC0KAR9_CHOFU|nr:hypothetical protein MSG28_015445 [Choristoneura fumiferana]
MANCVQLPKQLQPMAYQVQFRAPGPPPPGVTRTPEEIEAEMKKVEAQYEKLALVFIELPRDVMWSEPPVICQWQESRKLWTSNYVNDYKFNEDKLTIQFRSGVLGPCATSARIATTILLANPAVKQQCLHCVSAWRVSMGDGDLLPSGDPLARPIGIATLRYSNLPYQGWDLRPDPNGKGVLITVTGACVTVTWVCVGNSVALRWIANATTSALREHFNKKYSVKRMAQVVGPCARSARIATTILLANPAVKQQCLHCCVSVWRIMREASCDFFPDFDGHSHVEGTCPKEWVAERHNYHAMAFMSRAYNFQWSRWNATAGSRNVIMQLREAVDKKREAKLNLLIASPQRATILKCNELSTELSMEPMVGLGFYPDLFTLNMSYGSVDARRATFDMKFRLVETVFNMLQELKLSSYS